MTATQQSLAALTDTLQKDEGTWSGVGQAAVDLGWSGKASRRTVFGGQDRMMVTRWSDLKGSLPRQTRHKHKGCLRSSQALRLRHSRAQSGGTAGREAAGQALGLFTVCGPPPHHQVGILNEGMA